jgi:tetratricopeptide (TPR) repeat protein
MMSRSKKPVLIVAAVLGALIVIPLALLVVTQLGGSAGGDSKEVGAVAGGGNGATEVADFDLRQLANRAEQLIEEDMAEALRQNAISLDFMSGLKREAEGAAENLARGRLDQAREAYERVIETAEGRLSAIALADRARELSEATFSELERLERLKRNFENTYNESVAKYNSGLSALNAGAYQTAVDDFEMSQAILGDLEARSIQQIGGLLEAGHEALENYQLETARQAFDSVIGLDADNAAALEGLAMVESLDGISDAVQAIRELEKAGQLEEALAAMERLAELNPDNPFIKKQRQSLEARIAERDFQALVAQSQEEEAAEEFGLAIASLEAALEIKSSAEQEARLEALQERYKAVRLEVLLTDGYSALTAGRYEAARNFYKEAVALAPESKEARTGLEKASSLYLANIRYNQNIAAAAKYIEEGRFPLAAKLFNEAMASRPSKVVAAQSAEEARIRNRLEAQSEEVPVTIRSDRRTYVSMIGVFPPDRLREKELKLFPDVYKVRGTRPGYAPVEIEFKVDATQPNPVITVECTEKL